MPGQFMESIKFNFQESYGKFKMCSTCATYTDLSFLIIDEIHRVWLSSKEISKQVTEMFTNCKLIICQQNFPKDDVDIYRL